MTGWLDQKEALLAPILKHMPTSAELCEQGVCRADRYASEIAFADRDKEQIFGISSDAPAIENLRRQLMHATRTMEGLSSGTHSWFNIMIGGEILRRQGNDAVADFSESLDLIVRRLSAMRKNGPFSEKASAKRNWHAVAVALRCREAWGEEAWVVQNGSRPTPSGQGWGDFLDESELLAPRAQHHLRPGPFGRFLEEVFFILKIEGSGGATLSAATALDSLSDLLRR